jgi:predicted DNA-binding mobile mystery protein A
MARTTTAAGRRQARRALDERFAALPPALASLAATPRGGWVRAIREALGMSADDLATKMDVVASSVLRLEASERAGSVQLDTLRRAAFALDCELVYVLVPRQTLTSAVEEQSRRKAARELAPVRHSMLLEDQSASAALTQGLLEEQSNVLRDRPGLWREH